jgi:phosphoglycolate phosphatase
VQIVFDLDGTLIDSAPDLHRAINLMLAKLGAAPLALQEVRGMVGDGASALIQRALAARHLSGAHLAAALQTFLGLYAEDPTACTRLYPEIPETLEILRNQGLRLAICTNKPSGLTHAILGRLRLAAYFQQVVGGDSLPYRKPDPRMLLHLLDASGTDPGTALLVGDSEIDAATAQAAGVPFVLVTYGYHRGPLAQIPCLAAIDQIRALLNWIEPAFPSG